MTPKFRAWDKNNAYMEYTEKNLTVVFARDGIQVVDHTTFSSSCTNMEDYVLMQSTGLFDRNGKEIYEGDIVKNEINELGYIEWSKCRFNFCDGIGHFYLFSIGARQPFEIIGNIYQDKHLLEEE